MKTFKKVFLSILIIFILLFLGLNFFLFLKGKDILSSRISQATGRQIKLEKVWFRLPFSINIDGITIDGVTPAKKVLIKFGFSNVFRSQFLIKRIVFKEAAIILIRDEQGRVSLKGLRASDSNSVVALSTSSMEVSEQTQSSATASVQAASKLDQKMRLVIDQIIFEDSRLEFNNQKLSEEDNLKFKQVMLEKFTMSIKDVAWPLETHPISFRLKGFLSIPDFALNQKLLKSDGWVNILKKDMDGTLDIAESESESSLHAQFVSRNNEMKVSGNIKMSNFMQNVPQKKDNKGIDQMIFGALSQMGVEVGLNFQFNTAMDQFEITNVSFTGNVVTKPVNAPKPAEAQK